jgi:hypothetical protein
MNIEGLVAKVTFYFLCRKLYFLVDYRKTNYVSFQSTVSVTENPCPQWNSIDTIFFYISSVCCLFCVCLSVSNVSASVWCLFGYAFD